MFTFRAQVGNSNEHSIIDRLIYDILLHEGSCILVCLLLLVCKYYSHVSCVEKAFNDCKQCATYAKGVIAEDQHHWIEGNLPSSARCQTCAKACSTTECLSGFRCGWCGITVSFLCAVLYVM